jgi:hypothetical protein
MTLAASASGIASTTEPHLPNVGLPSAAAGRKRELHALKGDDRGTNICALLYVPVLVTYVITRRSTLVITRGLMGVWEQVLVSGLLAARS